MRVYKICKEYGIKAPDFKEISNGFMVTLYKETINVTINVTENVTERRHKLIVEDVKSNNTISIDQLAEKLNVTRRTVIRDIEKMKKNKIITRIGPDKGGHWEVNEN